MSEETEAKTVVLPSNGQEVELPELSTEQVLQLIRLAKNVLNRVPDLIDLVEDARLDYLKNEAQGFVSKAYFEGLSSEEQTSLQERLTAEFQSWGFYEDLSDDDKEALVAIDITEESLKNDPVQFSFPSEVPMVALVGKVFPEIYDACADEIIMAVAVTLMNPGRLEKAVRTNTVNQQLMDYRAELTQTMKPQDFIHLAAEVVSYTISELRGLGGPLGQILGQLQDQIGDLTGSAGSQSESEASEKNSEKSEPESSTSSPETLTD